MAHESKQFQKDRTYKFGKLQPGEGAESPHAKFQKGSRSMLGSSMHKRGAKTLEDFFEKNPLKLEVGRTYTFLEKDPETGERSYFGESTVMKPREKPQRARVVDMPTTSLADEFYESERGTSSPSSAPGGRSGAGADVLQDIIEAERAEKGQLMSALDRTLEQNQRILDELKEERRLANEHQMELFKTKAELDSIVRTRAIEEQIRAEFGKRDEEREVQRAAELKEAQEAGLNDQMSVTGIMGALAPFSPLIEKIIMRFMGPEPPPQGQQIPQGPYPPQPQGPQQGYPQQQPQGPNPGAIKAPRFVPQPQQMSVSQNGAIQNGQANMQEF